MKSLESYGKIMKKTCYVTTPIYYASGLVHIGNSYSTLAADAFARFHRLNGYDTRYLTGMDEHGQKIEEAAKKANLTPQVYVNNIALQTKKLWNDLHVTNDDFIQTSEERHVKAVQKMFETLLKQGDIYLGEYEGDYCVSCETFFTKSQLNSDGTCPDCGKPTRKVKEESYFLNMKKYAPRLLEYIKANPNFIKPETRKNEVVSFLESGVDDLCASRTTFKWGIPVLSNPKHVVYVWLDALSNYITSLGYNSSDDTSYQKYWVKGDKVVHIVGKDILRFHAVIWPIMLMALNLPIPYTLYVHGWYLMKDGKMSKSRGNVVYPHDIIDRYGLDGFRYYMIKEMPLGSDALFTYERFIERYNGDLANDYGNLVSRTIAMVNKYFDGKIQKPRANSNELNQEFETLINNAVKKYKEDFSDFKLQQGIIEIMSIISRSNKYVDETAPWVVAKDENKKDELNNIMYHLLEAIRISSIMLLPVIPDAAGIFLDELNANDEERSFASLEYGYKKEYQVTKENKVIFKRLDMGEELKYQKQVEEEKTKAKEEEVPLITIDDFSKVDLRVGEVVEAKKVEGSDKLLVMKVLIAGKERQIVSGIAKYYTPEQMVGKKVVVVANLQPVKLRGQLSEGMILCASSEKGPLEVLEVLKNDSFSKVK